MREQRACNARSVTRHPCSWNVCFGEMREAAQGRSATGQKRSWDNEALAAPKSLRQP